MWNDGKFIIWRHILDMYNQDQDSGLKLLPRLTYEHSHLNSYSVMRVNLAAQVLSSSMARVLQVYGPPDSKETAKFCEIMDSFFDCTNVRSTAEGERTRKQFVKRYRTQDDECFAWLENDFLGYLNSWKENVDNRVGNFAQNVRARMLISWKTYEGLQITVYSLIEATKFLLGEGSEFVLTERFCQEVVEEYFGRQRAHVHGRRNDNLNLYQFGYNDNAIRIQRTVTPVMGNTRGAHKGK